MILHKGEIVEKAVRNKRFPITLLAERLGLSRRHIYNIFNNPDVSLDLILKIGKIIQYDFNDDLKAISKIPAEYKIEQLSEPDITFETITYWKSKYFELLEQHHLLLNKKIENYFNGKN
jgi:predicted transcriptional regulator